MTLRWPLFIARSHREPIRLFRLRLFTGGLVLYREALVALGVAVHPAAPESFFHPAFFAVLAAFVLTGFCTRLSYFLLALFYVAYNLDYKIMNLGPLFLLPLFWCGCLLDARPLRSLDAALVSRFPAAARLLFWGKPPELETFNFVYGILFFVYAVNSFAAILFHLNDPYWLSGQTVHALLVNNFLSTFFPHFRELEAVNESLPHAFSALSCIFQTLFQLFMFPLVFWRWGRWFVVFHGFVFFLISLFFIQISILPFVEIAWWLLLFGPWISEWRTMPCSSRIAGTPLRRAAVGVFLAGSLLSVTQTALNALGSDRKIFGSPIRNALMHIGIWPPNVFNVIDLQMGQTWFVLYRSLPGGELERVPVFAEDGARLAYHLSDFVYFGHTLGWRRGSIGIDWPSPKSEKLLEVIGKLAAMDKNFRGLPGPQKYLARIMRDRSMDFSLTLEERYRVEELETKEYDVE